MQTVQARWYRKGRTKPVRLIVIHCTVSNESGTGAEAVARYFATTERKASAHRVADNNSTVQCVADEDTAFAAAGANADGIHMELVGRPEQSEIDWLDAYSRAELFEAGLSLREWARDFAIPYRWLTVAEVADGNSKGFCTHADVSQAFPNVSTGHWDPGPHFPKAEAMRIWTPDTEEEIDMATADEIMQAIADMRQAVELRLIEFDDDVPENLKEKIEQIQRNVTRIGNHLDVPNIEGTAT